MKDVKTRRLPSQSRGVKTSQSQCRGHGLDPWLGNYDPTCHMAWPKRKKERKVPACLDFSVEQRETDNKQKYIESVTPHITVMAMEWGRGVQETGWWGEAAVISAGWLGKACLESRPKEVRKQRSG